MSGPALISDIPWEDPPQLQRWVHDNPTRVTPAAAERLLGNEGFVEAGPMPTTGRTKCVAWRPTESDTHPELAFFTVNVYYTDALSSMNVQLVLAAIEGARSWKLLHRIDL